MLLRTLRIVDKHSPYHGQILDVRIVDGKVAELAERLDARENEEVISLGGHCLSPGFVDIGAYLGEPGHEERNDRESLLASALKGGYVAVAVLPDASPVRQTVGDLRMVTQNNGNGPVDLLPIAALSRDLAGKDLTGMLELTAAGAVGFTNGIEGRDSASLVQRGLEYALATETTIFLSPFDASLGREGQIHEGEISTRMGLRGIPEMCETIPLRRNLELAHYTGGKAVTHLVSSAESVKILGAHAGARATVSANHLQHTVDQLTEFSPNFKILPPLREEADRLALVAAVNEGTVTAIVSNHQPRHGEEKDLEFSYADFGARGLETTFRQLLSLGEALPLERIVEAITVGPRQLLGLDPLTIDRGSKARLTLFTTEGASKITRSDLPGPSVNNPTLGHSLPGRVAGIVYGDRFFAA